MKWTFLIPTQCRIVTATPKKSFNPFLPPANEVWRKIMFSLACVILFTGERSFASRGSASRGSAFWRGLPPGGSDSGGLPPGGSASRGVGRPPSSSNPAPEIHGILRDTVNKQEVRILLECFLVSSLYAINYQAIVTLKVYRNTVLMRLILTLALALALSYSQTLTSSMLKHL